MTPVATANPTGGFDPYEQRIVTGGEMLRQDRVTEARAEFEKALEVRPGDPKALGLLGLTLFRLSDFQGALPVYRELVATTPSDPSLRMNLGLVYLKLGLADDAIEELTRSRDLDPSQTRAVSYLGLAYARTGEYARAYQAFLQAGQSDLAREMEQYLSPEEREAIVAQVTGRRAGTPLTPPPMREDAAAEPEPAPAAEPEGEEIHDLAELGAEEINDDAEEISGDAEAPAEPEQRVVEFEAEPGTGSMAGIVIQPADGQSAVSAAVESAAPSAQLAKAAVRTAAGAEPPIPLSEFATRRLIRPEDGDHAFEISAGGVLIVRVDGRIISRTEGVIVSGGELAYETATRRVRGAATNMLFAGDGRPMFFVTGTGHLVASPLGETFTAVNLDDDILYLREDLVYAFEEQVRWENGNVPGSNETINMVQFRGHGAVAMRSRRPLLSVKLAPERVLYVDAEALAGWIGRVVPRLVQPAAGGKSSTPFVECAGEGVVLIEEHIGEQPGTPHEP